MKLAMYESVLATLKGKQSLLDASPALTSGVDKLELEIEILKNLIYRQLDDTKWITARKHQLCDELVGKAFKINKLLVAYAVSNELTDLVNRFSITTRDFMSGGVQGKLARVNTLLMALPDHLNALQPYSISETDYNDLYARYQELEEFVRAPRLAQTNKSFLTLSVRNAIKKIDHFLVYELDAIMVQLENLDESAFYQYKSTRKLVHYGSKHRDPKAESSDQDDGTIE